MSQKLTVDEVLKNTHIPVRDPIALVPSLPDCEDTQIYAGEKSVHFKSEYTQIESKLNWPYYSLERLENDLNEAISNAET